MIGQKLDPKYHYSKSYEPIGAILDLIFYFLFNILVLTWHLGLFCVQGFEPIYGEDTSVFSCHLGDLPKLLTALAILLIWSQLLLETWLIQMAH